jgi:hypothetical protein
MGNKAFFQFGALGLASLLASCGGGESTNGGATLGTVGGTWTITSLGDDPAGPGSSIVIANDTAKGTLVDDDEGKEIDGCTQTKSRTAVDFTFAGNTMSGTLTVYSEWTGNTGAPSYCPTSHNPNVVNVTAQRSNAGAGMDGDWNVSVGDSTPFTLYIANNTAKAFRSAKDKERGKDPTFNAVIAGNSANSTGDDKWGFSAKRQ